MLILASDWFRKARAIKLLGLSMFTLSATQQPEARIPGTPISGHLVTAHPGIPVTDLAATGACPG